VITGQTRVLGIIGWPLGHTLSPALHNFVLQKLGVPMRYIPFPVEDAGKLDIVLRGLQAAGVAGVNVTIPHKVACFSLCDDLTPDARAAGAVNTIKLTGGRLLGHDTDIAGFGRVIAERRVVVTEKHVLLLGAGGAARAAAVFLSRAGAHVLVASRHRQKSDQMIASVTQAVPGDFHSIEWEERNAAVAKCQVIVNTTPIGMWPRVGDSPLDMSAKLGPGQTVYDVVYNPIKTRLVARAQEAGANVLDGLDMLIHQAFEALELWTDRRIDRGIVPEVRKVLESEVGKTKPATRPEMRVPRET
jgi:shikimate dehydrogenase